MAAGLIIFPGAQPSRGRNGGAVVAELRFYLNETSTPTTVYTDAALTIPHEFPILSDSAGRFDLIYADEALSFTGSWVTADGQSKTYDDIMPSVSVPDALLDALGAAKLAGGNTFTGLQTSDVGFRSTGATGTLGFDDWANDRQYKLYSSNDVVAIYDGVTNILELTRAGALLLRSTAPQIAAYDTDVAGKGGAFRLLSNYSAAGSFYNFLEGGGLKIDVSDANAGSFSSARTILELFTNTAGRTDDTGAFFPNGGQAIGEDGHAIARINVVEILSDNTLHTADIPSVVSHTITAGAFTAISLQVGKTGYAANANGTSNKLYRVAAQGIGRPNVGHTNLIGWLHTDGAGATTGTVTIEVGGTDYVQDEVIIVGSPPPGATALDVGPQINLSRDAPSVNGGYLGSLVYQGRSAGASSVDVNYAQLLLRVIDNTLAGPESALVIATAEPSGAGSAARWEMGKAITYEGLTRGAAGTVNAVAFQISNVDLFARANTWSATQTITSTDAGSTTGPTLDLYRNSASPAAADFIGAVLFSGEDSAGNAQPYAQVSASIGDPTSTSEDGVLNLRTIVAGAFDSRFHVGAGLYATGLTDTGAGRVNAVGLDISGTDLFGAARTWLGIQTIKAVTATQELESTVSTVGAITAQAHYGLNDAATRVTYASIQTNIVTNTAAAEDGLLLFRTRRGGTMATRFNITNGLFAEGVADPGSGNIAASAFYAGSNRVVNARKTGWGVPTGTLTRTTFDTATVTLPQLAERVAGLIADLEATSGHGLLGA